MERVLLVTSMDKHFKFGLCSVLTLFVLLILSSQLDVHYLVTQAGILKIVNAHAYNGAIVVADAITLLLFCFLLFSF